MNIFFNLIISLLYLLVVSCADQDGKVLVEGAKPEVITEIEENYEENQLDDKINIEDTLEKEKTPTQIFTEKLIEVGDRVFFDYDQSRFKKEGVETLKRQARFLLENRDITVTIEGHCDARGTREYNLALGERRAYSVKSFLSSLGVFEDRISVISYGKEKLQASGDNESAWAQSRTAITVINP